MSKKKVLLGGTLIACMTALLLLVSCGQKLPTAPSLPPLEPSPVNLSINSNQSSDSDGLILDNLLVTLTSTFEIVYQDSGDLANYVEVPLIGDSIRLILPPYSVPDVVTITCLVLQGTNLKGDLITQLTFGPDGLVFKQPLELHYKSSAPEGTSIKFYWYDDKNGVWKLEQTVKVSGGWVVFNINHFSKYAVVDGSASNGSN